MSTSTVQSVNLLPTYFQTNKNAKFLASTIDQLIQPAQLERLNAYIGSTSTPTYQAGDSYVIEANSLRQAYQLEPALVTYNISGDIQAATAIDDLAHEIAIEGGIVNNFDRLFRSKVYPYYPQISWDKLVNYENYYWLPEGPTLIDIDQENVDIPNDIIGFFNPVVTVNGNDVTLIEGMLVSFSGAGVSNEYKYKEYFVILAPDGSVELMPYSELITPELSAQQDPDLFDSTNFDTFGFDNNINIPIDPQYLTINRASTDFNAWSRANRWISKEVITASAIANGEDIELPASQRAIRPIIEFNANIRLFNHGTIAYKPVDVVDKYTENAFLTISGTAITGTANTSSVVVDGIYLEHGNRIIFTNDTDPNVQNKIYEVLFVNVNGTSQILLRPAFDADPLDNASLIVLKGDEFGGTTLLYNGTSWVYAQQKTKVNQPPLFDLFDSSGISYSNKEHYLSTFAGNQIFGYSINENNPVDPVLGLRVDYRNIDSIGSFLFTNYFGNDLIAVALPTFNTVHIPTTNTYFGIDGGLTNVWAAPINPPITFNSSTQHYDVPLSLTNNPLNSPLTTFTLADLDEQAKTNTRLISNGINPMAFPLMFIGKKEHSVIDAIGLSADAYNQFKLSLIAQASMIADVSDPVAALDEILSKINVSKTAQSPYYLSDMIGFGVDYSPLTYTVSNTATVTYYIGEQFNLTTASTRSVLVYLNNQQLIVNRDYSFDRYDNNITMSATLQVGDVITINDYNDTRGSYVPPTPTKLGLYPAYIPGIYADDTYADGPVNVIQGHDGSIMVAFNDYRDAIILEYELRVYNNLKVLYRHDLLDVNLSTPGAFRDSTGTSAYSTFEVNAILQPDFVKWAATYGIDYTSNTTFDSSNSFTWNYDGSVYMGLSYPLATTGTGILVDGSWRAIFKYFYDTDRPHVAPWEMLGFSEQPDWWESQYGTAPYTAGNDIMWTDISNGYIANGSRIGIDPLYIRHGLLDILPVDQYGSLLPPDEIGLVTQTIASNIPGDWKFGDQGPAETAWRRSSYWPFSVQRLLALTKPAVYCSLMYDPANMSLNSLLQWTHDSVFLQLPNMPIHGENGVATSGYGVFVSEIGQQRSQNYITELRQDLMYAEFNLFHKVGGFVNQNTLQVIIDAYEPTTIDPGAILPNESYSLILNTSNPVVDAAISGIIIQRTSAGYVVRGYDRQNPYFTYYPSIRNSNTPTMTIGGVTASYVNWQSATSSAGQTLSAAETTTARSSPGNIFYQSGQIVKYGNNFYRVLVSHSAEAAFDTSLYQILPTLPTVGGATVQVASSYGSSTFRVNYGTTFTNIQDLYDLIVGYGAWLTDQGFVFDQYNSDLGTNVDWYMSGKEFLYWSTQNWASNSVITLSPFADQLTFLTTNSVVNNIFDRSYEYSFTRADGSPFPQSNLFVTRQSGQFTANVINSDDGIYFARLLCVQKEHGMVFDNTDVFGDIIYNPETGERQARMKLVGFRTANWNGDFFSPGFLYDQATVVNWAPYTNYLASDVVLYNSHYYSAIANVQGAASFVASQWNQLNSAPTAGLFPNFDYKISQFSDFYSLDIDNFDPSIQQAAQNLTGYTPRPYLNNIFNDPTSQYKFYQGFIREKGTANPIIKIAKASVENLNSQVSFTEEWAFRVGQYGSFTTYNEFELPLTDSSFLENPQVISFVESKPSAVAPVLYVTPNELTIGTGTLPTVATSTSTNVFQLLHSGYVRSDDVDATAYNLNSLLDIANNDVIEDGTTIWLGFTPDGDWDVLRYTFQSADIINVTADPAFGQITFTTSGTHNLSVGQLISVVNFDSEVDGIYPIQAVLNNTQFTVPSTLQYIDFNIPTSPGMLFTFDSIRASDYDDFPSDQVLYRYDLGSNIWVDSGNGTDNNGWAVYEKVVNYTNTTTLSFTNPTNEGLGYSISKPKGQSVAVIGSPYFTSNGVSGNVGLYEVSNNKLAPISFYQMNETPGTGNLYGYSVAYNTPQFNTSTYGLIFAGAPGAHNNQGAVVVTSLDIYAQPHLQLTIAGTNTGTGFGSHITVTPISTSNSLLLVSAPNTGTVYSYLMNIGTNSVSSTPLGSVGTGLGTKFGTSIAVNENAFIAAIGDPSYSTSTGIVYYYPELLTNSLTVQFNTQTINSPFGTTGTCFGQSIAMSQDGTYLAVSAPNIVNADGSLGAVAIFEYGPTGYTTSTIITNPVADSQMKFGIALDFNAEADALVITALGTNTSVVTYFDDHQTTFDLNTTRFTESETMSGSAYLYSRTATRFVYSEELINAQEDITTGTNYGTSVALDDDAVLIGAPGVASASVGTATSGVFQFTPIDPTVNGWDQIRVQPDLVIPDGIQKVCLVDTTNNDIVNYFDYVDPIKGKIIGIAQEELSYQTPSDPAIYSIGGTGTNVNVTTPWLGNHVGELWWDLSTAKFAWYEQGEMEFRRANWGTLFPGASIDVYEWVGSTLLPSDWAVQADTTAGLALGISGQPKFVDNSTVSVDQVYDATTNSFSNMYYFWVKNKVTVPNIPNRRTSAFNVASYIANPAAAGLQFASIIGPNTIMLTNMSTEIVGDRISLNFAIDNTNSKIPRHTEWQLMREGDETSIPPSLIERKMIDSLVGYSTGTGALVPDPTLTARSKFGIGIRPQQTLFNNRFAALENIVNFVNGILINVQVTGNYSFDNLNAAEPYPTIYDLVLDNSNLELIPTTSTSTMVVVNDNTYNGGWGVFESINSEWVRVRTQSYNTPLYWDYVDWVAPTYSPYQNVGVVIDETYQLAELTIDPGQYVKINNRGDGNYVIVQALSTASSIAGDFGNNYQVQYIQNGTIQLSNSLWDLPYGWDETFSYSQTLFDQMPVKEIEYILMALKNDLFINDLKVNWNKLFFTAVKYAVSEQPAIDWVFKTSFIDVVNDAGALTQPPLYKLQNSSYYEDFINEIKPYRTQIRNFTAEFDNTETNTTLLSDFEYPSYWNTATQTFANAVLPESLFVNPKYYNTATGQYTTATVPTSESLFTDPVRQISETIVFDRISVQNQIGDLTVSDTFIGDGATTEFVLSWVAQADRYTMDLTVFGEYVLPTAYTVKYYTAEYNGYEKQYSKLVFLDVDQAPALGATIEFTYQKSVELMSAVERIQNFYAPSIGMAGTLTDQLMMGVEDPRVQFGGQYEGNVTLTNVLIDSGPNVILEVNKPFFVNPYGGIASEADTYLNVSNIIYTDPGVGILPSTVPYPTWSGTNLINALGVSPGDLIIDGEYGFVTTSSAWAPEEVVPGVVADTLGIDVYTQSGSATPTILSGAGNVVAGLTCTFVLSTLPTTVASIVVAFNGTEFTYSTSPVTNSFNIDWVNKMLIIPPQSQNGVLTYTILGVGSDVSSMPGLIDYEVVSATNTTTAQVISLGSYEEINGAYVTVNGTTISTVISSSPYYELLPASATDQRASVIVYNLNTNTNYAVQAWFFDNVALFNQVNISNIVVTSQPFFDSVSFNTSTGITIQFPPNISGPVSSQAIVEATPNGSTNGTRLIPPTVTYYTVTATNVNSYQINDISGTFVMDPVYGDNARVYQNGTALLFGRQYSIVGTNVVLNMGTVNLNVNDVIAVESLMPRDFSAHYSAESTTPYSYDYLINNNGGLILTPNYFTATQITYSITTYNDQNDLGIETQLFKGNPYRTFRLSRPVLNAEYVWVTIDYPLTNNGRTGQQVLQGGVDFQVLSDKITILIGDAYDLTPADTVIVMSIADSVGQDIVGFRYFSNILGQETFTRLAEAASTYLTQPLYTTSTSIYLEDSSVLSPADIATNSPGLILIDGELIEYYTNENNVLGRLRRGVRGTGIITTASVGARVIDQGIYQTIPLVAEQPYTETLLVQNTYTNAALGNTYVINTQTVTGWINTLTSSVIRCDGISFMNTVAPLPQDPYTGEFVVNKMVYPISTATIDAKNQVSVYYGGYQLRKDVSYYHDTTVSYDSILQTQIVGTVPTASALTTATYFPGHAYVCQDTNQVWVCTDNRYQNSTSSFFVDSGLRQIPADFTINTSTQLITLNTSTVQLVPGGLLTVVMKRVTSSWNDVISVGTSTVSLTASTSTMAQFLQDATAILPDAYFYNENTSNSIE